MPTVPKLRRQISARPMPDISQRSLPNPNAYGAGLADTTLRVVSNLAAAKYAQARQDADETRLLGFNRTLADWEQQRVNDPQTGAKATVKGIDALDLANKIGEEFDTFTNGQIATMLPRQQGAARNMAERRRAGIVDALNSYGSREFQTYHAEQVDASLKLSVQQAIANADNPARITTELTQQELILSGEADRQGWAPEVREQKIRELHSATHVGVITQLLALDQDQAAVEYFKQAKEQIDGDQLPAIEQKLDVASTQGTGFKLADAVWNQYGPKGDSDAIDLDRLEQEVRTKVGDNAKLYDATVKYLRERSQVFDAARKDRDEATTGDLWKAVAGGASLSTLRRMPQYLNASGRVQAQLSDYIVNRQEREASRAAAAESRAAAAESRAYTRQQRAEAQKEREGAYMYYQYAKPETLGQMSDAAIWNLVPTLGQRNVERLLEQKSHYTTDKSAPDDFRSFTDVINSTLEGAGIDPTPKPDDREGRAKLGWLKEQVAAEQTRVQGITKKKITNDELATIVKSIIGRQVLSRGWIWNDQQSVMNATISDVPSADLKLLRDAFSAAGVANPTKEQLLTAWLAKRAK